MILFLILVIKKPASQKEFKEFVIEDMGNDQTPVTAYINNNAYRLTKDIIDIFAYINTVAGVNVITHKNATKTGVPHPVFNIEDTDLQKQKQIKQIRAANKALDLSKAEVANKVWKCRYIPPALESNYFERNLGENITKIYQLMDSREKI
jgi:hypothetical protein